jgi:GxxExxY protein
MMTENEISKVVVESSLSIHRTLGPGLFENTYRECLYHELQNRGLQIEKDKPVPLIYRDQKFDLGYKIDLLVEDKFIIEVEAVETLNDVHLANVRTYLKLSNCKLGMLINFNVALIKHGIKRVMNGPLD